MASEKPKSRDSGSEATRAALVVAALNLFGANGYEGTSTRQIATAANANIGSIAYHFGGKEGLREACAEYVTATIRSIAGPAAGLAEGPAAGPEEAEERLVNAVEQVVLFMVTGPVAGEIIQFVLRELNRPGPTLDIIYGGVFEPVHKRLCQLWEQATGDPAESEHTRIAVFTMIGQVVYLRIGREAVIRRMGWANVGPDEATQLATVVRDNVRAIIQSRRGVKP